MDEIKEPLEKSGEHNDPTVRVLVIDDDEDIRRLLIDILTSAGHMVVDTANGTAAIEIFKNGTFDLVLTDLEMPGLSGWEIARSLKKLSPEIIITLISGWGQTLDRAQFQESGIDRVVNKPFSVDEILNLAGEAQAKKLRRQK